MESTVFVQGTRWEPDAGLEWVGDEKSASTFTLPNALNEYVRPIIEAYLPPEQGEDEEMVNKSGALGNRRTLSILVKERLMLTS